MKKLFALLALVPCLTFIGCSSEPTNTVDGASQEAIDEYKQLQAESNKGFMQAEEAQKADKEFSN